MPEDNLDAAIADTEEQIRSLREQLKQREAALKSLRRARDLLRGQASTRGHPKKRARKTLIDAAEELLRERGELHINMIVEELHNRGYENAGRQTLTSAFSRCIGLGQRFRRTGPGKYALLEENINEG